MKLSIFAYGHSVLRQPCEYNSNNHPHLTQLIDDLWETMQIANGCGLAAPQIGKAVKLFIVDSETTYNNLTEEDREGYFKEGDTGIRETFINAKIIERSSNVWKDEEGCLSIPGIIQPVERPWTIAIEYLDKDFNKRLKVFSGATARMIQHEFDHTEGILYLDHLNPLSRKLLQSKLKRIMNGQVKVKYPMKYR